MRNFNKLKVSKIIFDSIVVFTSVIVFLVCVNFSLDDSLWLLPLMFGVFYFLINIFNPKKLTIVFCSIIGISFIRYVITPLLYYIAFDYQHAVTAISYQLENSTEVTLLMIYEMITIFLSIGLFAQNYSFHNAKINKTFDIKTYPKTDNKFGIFSISIIVVSTAIVFAFPQLLRLVGQNQIESNSVNGGYAQIYQVGIVILELIILDRILKSQKKSYQKLFIIILSYLPFIFLSSYLYSSISRNFFLINSFIFILIVFKFFPQYIKRVLLASSILIFLYFIWSSYEKFEYYRLNSNMVSSVLSSFVNYPTFNNYFAGMTNFENGLKLITGFSLNFGSLITDILSNVPILSDFSTGINTLELFNYLLFHGVSNDQIIPLSIQSAYYFGYVLAPLIVFITTTIALKLEKRFANIVNLFDIYCYGFAMAVLCISPILSLNSIFMLISIRIVPVLSIGYLDNKVHYKRGK